MTKGLGFYGVLNKSGHCSMPQFLEPSVSTAQIRKRNRRGPFQSPPCHSVPQPSAGKGLGFDAGESGSSFLGCEDPPDSGTPDHIARGTWSIPGQLSRAPQVGGEGRMQAVTTRITRDSIRSHESGGGSRGRGWCY